jgi:DNA-binding XRE family transcriptional regulator
VANIKMTPKVLEELYEAIAKGANITDAAGFVGVSRQAIYTLLHKERAKPNSKILDKIEASRAAFRKSLQDRIIAHGKSSWQAAAWILERRFPGMFGKKDTLMAKEMKELREELATIRAEIGNRQGF